MSDSKELPKIVWAKVPGFQFWPVKHCNEIEKYVLHNKGFIGKESQVAVYFFGSSNQRLVLLCNTYNIYYLCNTHSHHH